MSDDIKPAALLLEHRDGRQTLHPIAEYAVAYRDTAVSESLLYTRATLDAAVAAERERMNTHAVILAETARQVERERCAKLCDQLAVMSLDSMVCRGSAEECAEAIREIGGAAGLVPGHSE